MRWAGAIGFGLTEHNPATGKSRSVITEKQYFGDILKNDLNWKDNESINDDLTISNQISFLADEYAFKNQAFIKYALINGTYWKVSLISIAYPRMRLTLGGVYNGVKA